MAGTPAAVAWPDPYNTNAPYNFRKTCSILPDNQRLGSFFCFDPNNNCWNDVSPIVYEDTTGTTDCTSVWETQEKIYNIAGVNRDICLPVEHKPLDLAFVPSRFSTGVQASSATGMGNLYLSSLRAGSTDHCNFFSPGIHISRVIDEMSPIDQVNLWGNAHSRNWRDATCTNFTCLFETSNSPLYVDETMGTMVGAIAFTAEGENRLRVLPFADGSPPMEFMPISDFVIMERNICRCLKAGDANQLCGTN